MTDKKLSSSLSSTFSYDIYDKNPWVQSGLSIYDRSNYVKTVKWSRFFYRNEPIVSAIIDRIASIGSTEIVVGRGTLTTSEQQLMDIIIEMLKDYVKNAIRELLLSGILFTEVYFDRYDEQELRLLGVKYKKGADLPKNIMFRNPELLEIAGVLPQVDTSYYYYLPDDIVFFIQNKGMFMDGTENKDLYKLLKSNYPDLVRNVERGETKVKITPKYKVIYWNKMPDSVYPTPFLTPVIPILRHKRNIRKMDYSLASRAILMILHVKAGNDEYPVTKDDTDVLEALRQEMSIPTDPRYYDRIFQLFTNHTIDIQWITPPIDALLDTNKYKYIDEEILLGLGFPRLLLSAEAERSQASSQDLAAFILESILEPIRNNLLVVIRQIIIDIIERNNFRGKPSFIKFKPIHFSRFRELFEALKYLYETRIISRQTIAKEIGYVFSDEVAKIVEEENILKSQGIGSVAPVPYDGRQQDAGDSM